MNDDERPEVQTAYEYVHQDRLDVKPMALRVLVERAPSAQLLKDYAEAVIFLAVRKAQERAPDPDDDPGSWRPETEGEKEQARWEQVLEVISVDLGNRIDRALHRG